jgi:hypothetical protein
MDFLISMGFSDQQAQLALTRSHGNVDQAVDLLLSGASLVSKLSVFKIFSPFLDIQ